MFSTSKVGGSRGSTSLFFRAGTPSYTSHLKVQPGSSSIVNERLTKVKPRSSANLRGRLPFYSPSTQEGFFSETGLPPNTILGNSEGIKEPGLLETPARLSATASFFCRVVAR